MFAKIEGLKVVSFLPGRIKVRIDSLKGNASLGEQTATKLSGSQAVKKVAVDPIKGDVLIHYDRKLIKDQTVVDKLAHTFADLYPELDLDAIRNLLD